MSNDLAFFIELLLVFGAVIGFGVWQLISLRRYKARDAAASEQRARHPEGQQGPDDGQS